MFFSRVEKFWMWQFSPIFTNFQELVIILALFDLLCQSLIKSLAQFRAFFLEKASVYWWSGSQNKKTFFLQISQALAHSKMSLRIKTLQNRYLNDRNLAFWIHHHQRNKDSMIISSVCVSLQFYTFFQQILFDIVPYFRWAFNGIRQVIAFRRKPIVVIVEWWTIMVKNSPGILFPMSWKDDDSFRMRVFLLNIWELFKHKLMFFFLQDRVRTCSMSNKNWSHV